MGPDAASAFATGDRTMMNAAQQTATRSAKHRVSPRLYRRALALLVCLLGMMFCLARPAAAQTTLIVNRTTDDGSGSPSGSLSWAINQFNSLNVSNTTFTITFSLTGGGNTITLNGGIMPPINVGRAGQLGANNNTLIIDGTGVPGGLVIDGSAATRNGLGMFMAYSGAVTFKNLTLTDGLATGGAGGAGDTAAGGGAGFGGGILVNNLANVTTQGVTFSNLQAVGGAGGANAGSGKGGGGGTNGGNGGAGNGAYGGGGGLGGNGGDGSANAAGGG